MQASKFSPIIIATSIMVIISLFPFLNLINVICCAGIMIGGFAGSAFYAKQLSKTGTVIVFKDGAMIGLLSGLLSAIIVVLITTLITIISSQNPIPELHKIFDKMGIAIPPDSERLIQKVSDEYDKNGFSITVTIYTFIVYVITYPLFGALGGMIAASIYAKRKITE